MKNDDTNDETAKLFRTDREIDNLIARIKDRYPKQPMSGKVTCPVCKVKHALKISQVVHRGQGRIRAFCETDGCIRVME
jgi:hypothetical protein